MMVCRHGSVSAPRSHLRRMMLVDWDCFVPFDFDALVMHVPHHPTSQLDGQMLKNDLLYIFCNNILIITIMIRHIRWRCFSTIPPWFLQYRLRTLYIWRLSTLWHDGAIFNIIQLWCRPRRQTVVIVEQWLQMGELVCVLLMVDCWCAWLVLCFTEWVILNS